MREGMCEFTVEIYPYDGVPGQIAGRIVKGELRLGQRFTRLIRRSFHRVDHSDDGEDWEWTVDRADFVASVDLKVDRIVAYDKDLDRLFEVMTGLIVVSGEGLERLEEGQTLVR